MKAIGEEGSSSLQEHGKGDVDMSGDPDLELALQLSMQEKAGEGSQSKGGMEQVRKTIHFAHFMILSNALII